MSRPYNPVDVDFKKYGVLAVFYKGHSAGFDPEARSVEESAAGNLSAEITLECYNAAYCATPPYDPAHPWGIYVLLLIDKGSLVAPVKTLSVTTAFGSLALPSPASPKPPTLLTASQQNRHPSARFSMPGADAAEIYFANKPDRASDGGFLRENIKALGLLGTVEIRRGSWSFEDQLDPGTYYVMMLAADYDCIGQPDCIWGYSNMLTLTIPKPRPTYRAAVEVLYSGPRRPPDPARHAARRIVALQGLLATEDQHASLRLRKGRWVLVELGSGESSKRPAARNEGSNEIHLVRARSCRGCEDGQHRSPLSPRPSPARVMSQGTATCLVHLSMRNRCGTSPEAQQA